MAVLQIYKRNFSIQTLTFIQGGNKEISWYPFRQHSPVVLAPGSARRGGNSGPEYIAGFLFQPAAPSPSVCYKMHSVTRKWAKRGMHLPLAGGNHSTYNKVYSG